MFLVIIKMGWFPVMKAFFLVSYCFYQVWLLPLEIQLQAGSCSDAMMARLGLVSTLIIKFHSDGKHLEVFIKAIHIYSV